MCNATYQATSDLDRSHHCTATFLSLRCTLHPGHRGEHYDSIKGQEFSDALVQLQLDAEPTK